MRCTSPRVLTSIVTYNPPHSLPENVAAAAAQSEVVVIVDNASGPESEPVLRAAMQAAENVRLIKLPENRGVGAAHNLAIAEAAAGGFDWVLTLDHDTLPRQGAVNALLRAARAYAGERLGMLLPDRVDRALGQPAIFPVLRPGGLLVSRQRMQSDPVLDDVLIGITSGCLVPVSVYAEVGLLREDYFVDDIDTEFCLRLRCLGYRIIGVREAVVEHSLGDMRESSAMGLRARTLDHSPQRRYTIFRNRAMTSRLHGVRIPAFVVFDVLRAVVLLLKIALFEADRTAKLGSCLRGVAAGLVAPLPPYPTLTGGPTTERGS